MLNTHTQLYLYQFIFLLHIWYILNVILIELILLENIHASSLLIDMPYLLSQSFSFNIILILANYTWNNHTSPRHNISYKDEPDHFEPTAKIIFQNLSSNHVQYKIRVESIPLSWS